MENPKIGKLLIAEPLLGDPNFDRSVVLITEHGDQGTVGFVLNRPMGFKIGDLVPDFPPFECEVFVGGPVESDHLYFLHNRPDLFNEALQITENWYWGAHFDKLKEAILNQQIAPTDIRFFMGYSGWAEGQLADEISQNSWQVLSTEGISFMDSDSHDLWKKIITELGGNYALWANAPSDPLLN